MMRGFDSIESMNAEELLVKRKRGSNRFLVAIGITAGLFFLIGILVGYFSHNTTPKKTKPSPTPVVIDVDNYILKHVNGDLLKKTIRDFSAKPRIAGTKDNYDLALSIKSTWESAGLENVNLDTYQALLSYANASNPNKVVLVNINTSTVIDATSTSEPVLRPGDENSSSPSYSAFSPPGTISGALVYVNYGRAEDLEYVYKDLNIDLSGKILLVRLGKIYRWTKARNAETYNASALIMYSDPADINASTKDGDSPYPSSWWMPDTGIQQGTLLEEADITDGLGYPATDSAYIPNEEHVQLPKIPCQPVSFGFALNILSNMSGPKAPEDWQGGLSVEYNVGPGWNDQPLEIRLTVNNYLQRGSIHNVVGQITGGIEQDRYVIVGSHHDSWSVGATDPHSGGAALTQIAAMFGSLLKKGYRPRRTLLFCSWDAGEFGNMGTKEWMKKNLKAVQQDAVAYVNLDLVAEGHFTLGLESSPLLQDSLYQAAKKVPSPRQGFKSLYDLWLNRPKPKAADTQEPRVSYVYSPIGDHVPFYSEVGVTTANMFTTFDKSKYKMATYPLHHSSYDNSNLYETYQDPGLNFTQALTKFVAIWANDVANSSLIPFKVTRLSRLVGEILGEMTNTYREEWDKREVNIDELTSAAHNFSDAAKQFEVNVVEKNDVGTGPFKLRRCNDQMMQLGKLFSNPQGFPGMPNLKNIILASDPIKTNDHVYFPGITTTMSRILGGEPDLWPVLKQQVSLVSFYIQTAARSLHDHRL